ncbi:hypothetical protein VB712_03595 [Spirulina sp. CCNP1310]|uniref:hypothetical protein n=1 Tax=Spirulina sp. CCNP1310 TaxID=3110249 RepID=UPI002B20C8FC|nr:hypothetical protein [Spirulina sp. CCNP1310]MEA5418295.1 hypothetical protein [Spirulina sp. CCNP1310]
MKTQNFALFTATLLLVLGSNYLTPDASEGKVASHLTPSTLVPETPVAASLFAMVYAAGISDLGTQRPELITLQD